MKTMLGFLMVVGLALGGCGNNDCEDAADKIKECKLEGSDVKVDGGGDCSGASECLAKCVNDSSCADLTSGDLNNKFYQCFAKCGS